MKNLLTISLTIGLLTIGCEDTENGVDGLNILVNSEEEPIGENCSTGGTKLTFGSDVDVDGTLDNDEITNTVYVCNGLNGDDGLDGLDGNPNVDIQIVEWTSNMTDFTENDSPNEGDGFITATWNNNSLTSELVSNGVVLVQIGGSQSGPWFNLPYIIYDGDGSDVNYIYDSWYVYGTGTCSVSWDCSFGRTYSEWTQINELYETYYKIITIEGSE